MKNKKFQDKIALGAEEKYPLGTLKDFSKVTALQVAFEAGANFALNLPEVQGLLKALEYYANKRIGEGGTARKALADFQKLRGGE